MAVVARACLLLSLCAFAEPALAQKRIALLIGNQSYRPAVGTLVNPHNDVALLDRALRGLDFEVTTVRDASLATLHQAVNTHVRRVRAAGNGAIAFLYYSGHGAQDANSGTNYVIPVDVRSAEDSELWDRSLRLTEITRKLKGEAGNATHFVVFDACRNALKLTKGGARSLMQSKGFVPVREETGMLIAYATAEGELASDVGEGSGPYARVLADEIVKPGVEAVAMFRRVQVRVRAAINQEPWLGFSGLGEVYLAGAQAQPAGPTPAPPSPPVSSEAERAWKSIEGSSDLRDFEAFRSQYGRSNPFYDRQAARRIEELKAKSALVVPAPPSKQSARPGEWVELGCRRVSILGIDRDVIKVGREASHFRAIRLHVQGADVEVLGLKVVYANGAPDDLPVRNMIRARERTPPLDLRGSERTIDRVEMAYRALPNPKALPSVCVEGLR